MKKMAHFYKVLLIVAVAVTTSTAIPLLPLAENEDRSISDLLDQDVRFPREAESVVESIGDRVRIIFDQLPNGTQIESVFDYLPGALGVYYSIPRSFIDTVLPGPLPYGEK